MSQTVNRVGLLPEAMRFAVVQEMSARGISQAALASRTGFSNKHIGNLLNGTVHGSLGMWQVIMDDLGLTFTGTIGQAPPLSPDLEDTKP